MPGTAARTFACAADLFARERKLRYEGIAIASRIPRMMITTRSSIRVKPSSRFAVFVSLASMRCPPCRVRRVARGTYRPRPRALETPGSRELRRPSRLRSSGLKEAPGAADSSPEGHAGDASLNRCAARAHGGAGRLGPARDCGNGAVRPRARHAPAGRGRGAADPRRHAPAPLPDPLDRAAEEPRGRAPDRHGLLDPGPRALPRQRLLPARRARRRLP